MTLLDEDEPRRQTQLNPRVLDGLGVVELEAYVSALRGEIVRAEAEIARKHRLRDAAAGFFKT